MDSKRSIVDIMGRRYSNRTYLKEKITRDHREIIQGFISGLKAGPLGSTARFTLITDSGEDQESLRELGTYGVIRNAAGFFAGAVKQSGHCFEDYGYLLEKIVIHATGMGLATCWLGGTFSKSGFARGISLAKDEVLPAVVATGYAAPKPGLVDSIMRFGAGSKYRKQWDSLFFSGDMTVPLSQSDVGPYAVPIEMVRRAPSAANKQPWRIVKEPGKNIFHFYMLRTKMYRDGGKMVGIQDLQRVDMGIAMYHFEASAAESKLGGSWTATNPGITTGTADCEYIVTWKGK
ncbi:MAG TPA: nitroreductase family protein [Spirochaetota bacterium]|nr:nitroreductase family protein [Spirochaetota bacterium]HRZ27007.1 nitroreductase family protein [Spirochaetota bacterium]HSA16355.1 nitroreductase family protein [Spirochaetota bacterium]